VTACKKLTDRRWNRWVKALFLLEPFSCLTLVFCLGLTLGANAQQRGEPATAGSVDGKSAQGTLTVTATVVSSVGIVLGPNGEQVLVVANSPVEPESMMVLIAVQTEPVVPTGEPKSDKGTQNSRSTGQQIPRAKSSRSE
jgi:hypothetical protein